jgi:hypothetical protein
MLFNVVQPLKAFSPMLVTVFDIVNDIIAEHPLNALFPMPVTPFGIVKDVRLEQPMNA